MIEVVEVVFFYTKSSAEDQQKKEKVSTTMWHYIQPEAVGFICANKHFCLII